MHNIKCNVNNLVNRLLMVFVIAFFQTKAQNKIDFHIKKMAHEFSENTDFYKAAVFFLKKQNDSSLIYSTRQLERTNLNSDVKYLCHYFRGIAFMQKRMFKEAEVELKNIPVSFIGYSKTVGLLGDIALEQNNFRKAVKYYQKIINNGQFKKSGIDESRIIHNLGVCYLHLGEFKNARQFLLEGLKLHRQNKDTAMIIGSYMDIGGLYYEQYMDKEAIAYYNKAYLLSKNTKNYLIKKNAAFNMAVVEENRKNYITSLKYRKEYEIWNDSLNNQTAIWNTAQLEKQLVIKDKQNEVNILKAANKVKTFEKNRILYIAVLLFILLTGGTYLYIDKSKINKVILKQKLKLDESNTTKDMLFSVISHDLRSYINSVKRMHSAMLITAEARKFEQLNEQIRTSSSIVDSTHGLLNNLLHWALMQTGQLYFHREAISIFQIIQQVSYNYKVLMAEKNILFENTVSERTKVYADQESLKIILRNLLDNAIKYTESGGKVSIYETEIPDGRYTVTVEDTGVGMTSETIDEVLNSPGKTINQQDGRRSTGLGLQLCKLMTEKNSGSLDIKSEKYKGTQITFSLLKI